MLLQVTPVRTVVDSWIALWGLLRGGGFGRIHLAASGWGWLLRFGAEPSPWVTHSTLHCGIRAIASNRQHPALIYFSLLLCLSFGCVPFVLLCFCRFSGIYRDEKHKKRTTKRLKKKKIYIKRWWNNIKYCNHMKVLRVVVSRIERYFEGCSNINQGASVMISI